MPAFPTLAEIGLSLVVGVLGSLVASLCWIAVLLRIRPKLEISKVIARSTSIDGRPEFVIKVLNWSKRGAINIRAELFLINESNVSGGAIAEHTRLPLKFDCVFYLGGIDPSTEREVNGWRFVSYDDLDKTWGDKLERRLRFRLVATDEVSGFSRTFTQDFYTRKDTIKDSDFRYGQRTLEVG